MTPVSISTPTIIAVSRLLEAGDAVLLGGTDDLTTHLESAVLIPKTAAESERRDARQRTVVVFRVAADVVGTDLREGPGRNREVRMRLDALQHRIAAEELDDGRESLPRSLIRPIHSSAVRSTAVCEASPGLGHAGILWVPESPSQEVMRSADAS
jgi:hypothetical protein